MTDKTLGWLRIVFQVVIAVSIVLCIAALVPGVGLSGVLPESAPEPQELRLIDVMHKLEINLEQVFHAGNSEDWDLARSRVRKLEETAGLMTGRNFHWDQSNVSSVMEAVMPDQITALDAAIDQQDREQFLAASRTLLSVCNSCHRATNQLVVVQEPPLP